MENSSKTNGAPAPVIIVIKKKVAGHGHQAAPGRSPTRFRYGHDGLLSCFGAVKQ